MTDRPRRAEALGAVHRHPPGHVRGRGAGIDPPNRFEAVHLHVLDDELDARLAASLDGTALPTVVEPDATRTIINRVDPSVSPDLGFRWTINPYRGCEHGCVYCYARPSHEQLGYSSGLDFETRIVVKRDAPRLLRRELAHPRWRAETIAFSGVTDCYQPLERRHRITRGCLEVLSACRHPISICTKNRLITRDLDLLEPLARDRAVRVAVSITTLDHRLARLLEPRASSPADRLRAVRTLTDAGVECMVMVAPVIPGLNDREIPAILEAAHEAGAVRAGWLLLRLPFSLEEIFREFLEREMPDRCGHVLSLLRQARVGARRRHGQIRPTSHRATVRPNAPASPVSPFARYGDGRPPRRDATPVPDTAPDNDSGNSSGITSPAPDAAGAEPETRPERALSSAHRRSRPEWASGSGPIAEQIDALFRAFARRHGLDGPLAPLCGDRFVRPDANPAQGLLWVE